jgi:hypothetical protein
MKNNFKYLIALFTVVLFTSCEEELKTWESSAPFAQLVSDATVTITEPNSVSIPVILGVDASGTNSSGFSVGFTVTSDGDSSRYTVSPADGMLTFDPNSYEASITVSGVDNIVTDGDVSITITLNQAGGGVAGEGNFLVSKTVIVADDDCPTVFAASYNGNTSNSGYCPTGCSPYTITPQVLSDTELYLETAWGYTYISAVYSNSNYDGLYLNAGILTLNADFSVSGIDQYGYTMTGDYVACSDTWTYTWDDQLAPFGRNKGVDVTGSLVGIK